jgi:tRNA threonylcarbamoyl adenosine modification protein (Sua5/YciO/YrdC/YwlC family)
MSVRIEAGDSQNRNRAISMAYSTVRRGGLVIVPTESQYAVLTDAFSPRGTSLLREYKGLGPQVPLTVLVPNAAAVSGITSSISHIAKEIMECYWPGELTLLLSAGTTLAWDHPAGAPIAVRMPTHPFLLELLTVSGPLASSSAQQAGMPPITQTAQLDACEIDAISVIIATGDLVEGSGSTVIDCTGQNPTVLREGAVNTQELMDFISQNGVPQ